jgi:hypothetical protein
MDINLSLFENFEIFLHYLFFLLEGVYVLFAFLMMKQVRLMNTGFKTPAAAFFTLLARLHFLAAIIVLLISLVLLL